MKDKLRFAIIGAGRIAQSYAQAFEACEFAQVVAVSDVREDAASALAERLKCASFDSFETMCDTLAPDACIVCTPPATHEKICLSLIERGIHALCEKPLSIGTASAQRMLERAGASGVQLTMASKFRYVEDVVRAKSIVESGLIGDIILFENAFTSRVDMRARWNSDPEVSGGGVLIDNGTHSLDICRYFLGPLAEIQAVEGRRSQQLAVEETVHLAVRSANGVMANIDLSWSIDKELPGYINIYGSQGTLSVGWRESKFRTASASEWTVFGDGYDKVQAFKHKIVNFARSISGAETSLITAADALASVEAVEAAYIALRQDKWTRISNQGSGRLNTDKLIELGEQAVA